MGFWFRRKYNLPPNDPCYLSLTQQEIIAEYWAHHYAENGATEEIEDDGFDLQEELARIAREAGDDDWEEVKLDD